jgi:formate dehydrogenase iron-sulfur subunit
MHSESTESTKRKGLLIDVTRCIGCGACVEACNKENNLPGGGGDTLSYRQYTVLQKHGDFHVRKLCMHCEDPSCVAACPIGAMTKRPNGAVVWNSDICFGCRYCMIACPFGIPTFEWYDWNPRIRKCTLCYQRIEAGRPTACAEACPTEATVFGDRDTLIKIAEERIRIHAKEYHNHVLGLTEVGGTSVMYLSAIPFSELGFNEDILQSPPSEVTWRILSQVPTVVVLGAWVLGGFYWLYRRRDEVKAAEAHMEKSDAPGEGGHQ